jgi:small subunit ribosomal protein S14
MAKESMKARERKREKLVTRYAKKREELTKILKSTDASEDVQSAKWDAMMAIQKLPANSYNIRKHYRCGLTVRPRGYMRQFGLCRNQFRDLALAGKIPGVTKASW